MSTLSQRQLVFVGSYAEADNTGVYVYEFDPAQEAFHRLEAVSGLKNPTFLCVDADHRKIYSIAETHNESGERIGEAVAFTVDPETGRLSELNRARTIQPSSSHIALDGENRYIALSGYHGGNVGLVKLEGGGLAGRLVDEQRHTGKGADPERQDRPHPHSALFSPDNRYMLVADLGLDLVRTYAFDAETGTLSPISDAVTPPGSGPRHMTFHPNGKWVFSINEVGNSMTTYQYDAESGRLTPIETISTLPEHFQGENTTAEVAVSKDGRFLYGSNRGHDSIVQFSIDQDSGRLSLVEHVPTQGGHPRHFALTPDGGYLIAANRDANNLVLFRVDRDSGRLQFTGKTVSVSKPVCVRPVLFG
ncbi:MULTISPECIES: lactonase family protein [Paenibacillus]|uniref:lactonase family protein n=1 Tax=Paenibacillus TaxID=44249 RepID=UPI002FE26E9B